MHLCKTTCYIAIVLFTAMIYLMLTMDKISETTQFIQSLDQSLINEYRIRSEERRQIYFRGFSIGLLLSGILLVYNLQFAVAPMSRTSAVCLTGAITFMSSYLYYMLAKKQPLMVNLLKQQKQRELWSELYRKMQFRYHLGLTLGVIAMSTFSSSVC